MSAPEPSPGRPPDEPVRRGSAADPCERFRGLLERHLEASLGAAGEALQELSWHEHLLGCGACRELLEAEEALEHFLASLPAPELPPALARRVVRRLRARRETAAPAERAAAPAGDPLDRLLALDAEAPAAAGLTERVLSGLASVRGAAPAPGHPLDPSLDRLLERDRVTAPPGLAQRVLAGLAAERPGPRRLRPVPAAGRSRVWSLRVWGSLAAGLLAVLGAGWLVRRDPPAEPALAERAGEPDDELLAALPVLEMWDLLEEHGDEVELVSDPVYELLLDFSDLEGAPERAEPPTEEKPSKG